MKMPITLDPKPAAMAAVARESTNSSTMTIVMVANTAWKMYCR
jgi:hypothetical protein